MTQNAKIHTLQMQIQKSNKVASARLAIYWMKNCCNWKLRIYKRLIETETVSWFKMVYLL